MLTKRALLFQQAENDRGVQEAHLEMCRRYPTYWFNNFCMTFDPRADVADIPFRLFPFQEECVREMIAKIDAGEDILVEKSRDMGLSWIVLLVFEYCWLFRPGYNFHLGSRKEEYVDKKGNISTLFEKMRYNINWLPVWMKPVGWEEKQHSLFMRLINPENGNIITGESSNPNFARGGRYKAILFDEFPFWEQASLAFASAGQATPCRVLVGTPYGKANRFAQVRFSGNTKILSYHWRLHPNKDEEWYEQQKKRMTRDEIARELDISYDHSVEGIVFSEFTYHHVVSEPYTFDPYLNTIVSFDFGRTMCALLAQKDVYGRLHIFKEIIVDPTGAWGYKGGSTADLGRITQAYLGDLDIRGTLDYICDPAGCGKDHKSMDVLTILGMGFEPLQYGKALAMRDRLQQGVTFIKKKLTERIGEEESINVYERGCPMLIEAFRSGFRYKQDHAGNITDTIDEQHPYSDPIACLRYMLIEKFNVQGAIKIPSFKAHRGNPYTGY